VCRKGAQLYREKKKEKENKEKAYESRLIRKLGSSGSDKEEENTKKNKIELVYNNNNIEQLQQ